MHVRIQLAQGCATQDLHCFEPSLLAAQARLDAIDPDAYARTRNALDGAVTRLSPYLTHGFLTLRDVYCAVHSRHPLDAKHKLVFELGWRAYWRHVWSHLGDGIHQSIHTGVLPDDAYQHEMPSDVLEARTGIPAIDLAVRELYDTGYVHNHARMWLASYLVHLRKVHWHTGAQWMLGHLLDGDLASNHLSWQWVAGTGSTKPYLFNADNVAKYSPVHWHSPGTAIDTTYEALDVLARSAKAIDTRCDTQRAGAGIQPPTVRIAPDWPSPSDAIVDLAGKDVWLHHPWSVDVHAGHTPSSAVHIGVGLDTNASATTAFAAPAWSERRWNFVTGGLRSQTICLWFGSVDQVAAALKNAKSVQWHANLHADAAFMRLQKQLNYLAPDCKVQSEVRPFLFEPVDKYCRSFSEWWKRTRIAQ